ncbi:MAG: hypothetical protein U5K37_12650 [Natrialbaceae archaeon]|nr:hypothetical protein [Natrialbaceae archaeon]
MPVASIREKQDHGHIVSDGSDVPPVTDGTVTAPSVDWPYYQFNTQNTGVNPNVADGPGPEVQVKWMQSFGEVTVRGPVLQDEILYLTTKNGLVSIRASTGERLYTVPTDLSPSTEPTVTDERVFFGTSGKAICVDKSSNTVEWDFDFEERELLVEKEKEPPNWTLVSR